MTNMIVSSLILLLVVGLNYGCEKLAKTSPDIISGFKLSDDPEQKERDMAWLRLTLRNMRIANIVTLVGGIVGIACDLQVIYCLSLVLPITIAVLLSYSRRKTIGKKKSKS